MVFKKGRKPMAINRVTNTKRTDKAFITGETPNRIIEYTYRGNVVEPGPDTKKVITKSSKDMVTAIIKPERIPGKMLGIITFVMLCRYVAPNSREASIMEQSNSSMRAVTIRYTKGRQKVV